MKKVTPISLFIALLICNHARAMESQKTHLVIVPGSNGVNTQNIDSMLPYFAQNNRTHVLKNFYFKEDDDKSLKHTNEIIIPENINNGDPIILYGLSQGAMSAIQYTSNNPDNIAALILHNTTLTDLQSVRRLPQSTPIILIHDSHVTDTDAEQSLKDTQAIYAYLKEEVTNRQMYLFTPENQSNKQMTSTDITAINSILKLYELIPFNDQEEQMIVSKLQENYQPEAQDEWIDNFNEILYKKESSKHITTATKVVAIACGLYVLGEWLGII